MQVTAKPRRWPVVVAILALLAICLSAPRYWRADQRQSTSPDERLTSDESRGRTTAAKTFSRRQAGSAAAGPTRPAAKNTSVRGMPAADDAAQLVEPSPGIVFLPPPPNTTEIGRPTPAGVMIANSRTADRATEAANWPPQAPIELHPLVGQTLHSIGRALANCSPEVVAEWAHQAVMSLGHWPAEWKIASETPVTPIESRLESEPSAGDQSAPLPDRAVDAVPTTVPPLLTLQITEPAQRVKVRPSSGRNESQATSGAPAHKAPVQPSRLATGGLWSRPDTLFAQLEWLAQQPDTAQWAVNTLAQLRSLFEESRHSRGEADALLAGLSRSAATAVELADHTSQGQVHIELLRAHWALVRRIDCWTALRDIRLATLSETRVASRELLSPLFRNWPQDADEGRRLESLSANLESYERSRHPEFARRIAQAQRELQTSGSDLDRALADSLDEHYRNANVRVAVTSEILNRFVSEERVESRPVRERIVGTPVRGKSETVSRSEVGLLPALGSWQMELRTQGIVESYTTSVGRARVSTHGETRFSARTPIVVDAGGAWAGQTAATAENCSQLVGVATGLDWIPLFGGYARNRAVEQYRAKRPRAKAEVEEKVIRQTQDRVDARTTEVIGQWRGELEGRITDPLAQYGIEVTPLELTTTSERIVARLRIAGADQLASHTPRPQALSDSVASMQIHESALTNAAAALELNGERLTAAQLQTRLREKLPRLALADPPEAGDEMVFEFAAKDALQIRIDGGRLELTLSVVELYQPGERIRDFIVHAYYTPVVSEATAELVRDQSLGIEGALRGSERARLHNVFNVVFPEERRLPIFRPDNPADPRLAGLMITQLVLEDGWLGAAIGPRTAKRVAERNRSRR